MKTLLLLAALSFARENASVTIGKSVTIPAGETATEVVVIGGDADVQGAVDGSVVVIGGEARINAPVDDDVVALGSVTLGPKAVIEGDVVAVGGTLDADPAAKIRGARNVVTTGNLPIPGGRWLREGPFQLRLIPHADLWAWALAGLFLLGYVLVAAGAPRPVGAAVAALEARPATALLAGLGTLGLVGPVLLLLVISVAGLFVLPFLLCLAVAGFVVGKAALFQFVGQRLGRRSGPAAALIGGVVLTLPLAVPVLGLLAWGLVTAWAMGAAVLAGAELLKAETRPAQPAEARPAEPPAPPLSASGLPRATFGQRAAATGLDLLFVAVLTGVAPMLTFGVGAWAVYQVALWTWKGTTLGGIVCGIRGERLDGRPMDFTVALVRHLASYFSAAAAFVGFFWAAWDPEAQTWHDKIAGTVVVRAPKSEPLV